MQADCYKIVKKIFLNEKVCMMSIYAPLISSTCKVGQFVILRVDEKGERIPLTIAGYDKNNFTVDIIFQIVGATTFLLSKKNENDTIADFVGPLGNPSNIIETKSVVIIAGGVGSAIALPIAKEYKNIGATIYSILGYKTKDMIILENEFSKVSNKLYISTDDGSYGIKGFVTDILINILNENDKIDRVVCIGPLGMMKNTVNVLRPFNIPITCSMNSIMIDGTGMCGCCRLTLYEDGKKIMKFACVDGPEFDGYKIDFDEAMYRSKLYNKQEKHKYEEACNLFKEIN